ncbi:MAG TPA: RHS repeat-associated core domain-containing protein [Chitinophagaceae bacterium]|nr:RHS repeat-associated core domain-containing protein [Chitinophagaceae bacterium]
MVPLQPPVPQGTTPLFDSITFGSRVYELPNHLQNVMVTVSDKKIGVDENGDGIVDYYVADVVSAQDYYPFGQLQPGRQYGILGRYGFNGKENDNEVKGEGNQQNYGMRIYDPRLGRFLSVDPLTQSYPWYTPYQFAGNMPIWAVDLDGLERLDVTNYNATTRTANIQIVKNIYVNSLNIPRQVSALGNTELSSIFSSGNTTLYVSAIPQNGGSFQLIDQSVFDAGTGFKIEVSYNVNVQNTSEPGSVDVNNAANSLVQLGSAGDFSNPLTFARADVNGSNNVYINPNFIGFGSSEDLDPDGIPSYEELISHEVGFHNMARLLHRPNARGNAIYPTGRTLESNLPGQIAPSQDNTIAIINSALSNNNLNDPSNFLRRSAATSSSNGTPAPSTGGGMPATANGTMPASSGEGTQHR